MEQCGLCLQNVSDLRNSHYLSKGIYRILRDVLEKNSNPWVIMPEAAFQMSRQMTAYLLCGSVSRGSRSSERLRAGQLSARRPELPFGNASGYAYS
jgi:hypothetical protein